MLSFHKSIVLIGCSLFLIGCKTTEVTTSKLTEPSKHKIYSMNTNVKVSETYLNNLGDLNQDGIDDFLVSFMIDPDDQGLRFNKVSRQQHEQAIKPPSFVYLSTADGNFKSQVIPESLHSLRMWVAKRFDYRGSTYIVFGKNGELGLPDDIPGEQNAVVKVEFINDELYFHQPVFEEQYSTTADITLFEDENKNLQILFYNYLPIVSKPKKYHKFTSVIRTFDEQQGFAYSGLTPTLSQGISVNNLKVLDIDEDGKLDVIAGAEVIKTIDRQATTRTTKPGSYIVMDWFNSEWDLETFTYTFSPIVLPPKFGNNHAGFDVDIIKQDGRTFILETSSYFQGLLNGSSKGYLTVYEFKNNDVEMLTSFNLHLDTHANQSKILKTDIDHDGNLEVVISKDKTRKYYKFIDGEWVAKPIPHKIISGSGPWSADKTLLLLKNSTAQCNFMVSTLYNSVSRTPKLLISNCQ